MCLRTAFLLLLLRSFIPLSFSQGGADEKLAQQFYQNKEFDKAVVYYEKIFSKDASEPVYQAYLNCLLELKDFKIAEKTVKREIRQNPSVLGYIVDLGHVYDLE